MKNIPAGEEKRKPLAVLPSKSNLKTFRNHDSTVLGKAVVTGEPLEVSLPQVVFTEIEADQSYEIQLQIKNVTGQSRRIKLIKPKDTRFELSQLKEVALAPGLSYKVSVFFYVKEVEELHSSMKILSEDYQHELPISAYPPAPCLIFEPFVNFGYARVGRPRTETLEIHNEGAVAANVTLECDVPEITISPKKISLEAKGRTKISLTINATTLGTLGGFINILPKQRVLSEIEFSANIMDFSRFIINEQGAQIEEIETKPLLVGERSQFSVFIINNTPKVTHYRLSQAKGSESSAMSNTTPEEVGRQDTERILYFEPMQGKLEAYSQTKVTFDVEGKIKPNFQQIFQKCASNPQGQDSRELENPWLYLVTFHFEDDEKQQLKLQVSGACLIPKVYLSATTLEYGTVSVGDHSVQFVTLKNDSESSVAINFPKSKNYDFKPSKTRIAGKAQQKVEVRFHPKKNGQLNEVYMIEVGAFRLPLKLFGIGKISPTAHQSVIDGSISQQRQSTLQLSSISKSVLQQDSTRFFDMSKMHISSICQKSSVFPKEEPLKMIRKQRLERQKEEEMVRLATNCKTYQDNKPMDYEFENKLNATIPQKLPQLSLSKDPLYVDRRQARLQHSSNKTNVTFIHGGNAANLDPFKTAPEYPGQPKNQNEERIVNRQLQPEQLRQVNVGPTTIPIENIFIGAEREATFHIINNNKLPISIQMVFTGQELVTTCKQIQILPSGSAGGLRFVFKALEFGDFRLPVQYILNGKHFFEFSVVGTVIPPTLSLSRAEVKFCLTEQDKQFSKAEKLVLKNVYDYQAKFKLVSPSGVFETSPDEGVVAPHSDLTVLVRYHPNKSSKQFQMQLRTDEQKLRLKVLDGNQIQIKCSSQVTESSCCCKPIEINFKDTAICRVSEQRFMVKNNGRSGTAIQVECPPELEGMVQVSPQKKHLSIDETAEITVRLSSSKSGLVDTALLVHVRCGKVLQIPIRANILLPKIAILEQQIDFGSIPKSGTPAVKTCTLANQSNIWVDLELNLGSPDSILYRCLQLNLDKVDDRLTITTTKPKDPKHTKPLMYHIRIAPKCECKLTLMFVPEDVMPYAFNLPLNIAGYGEYLDGLQRPVSCKGIVNKLIVEPKEIDFKRVIIQTEKGLCKYQQVRLSNPTPQQIQWWTSDDDILPFCLERTRGSLAPFSSDTVRVSFYPSTRGEYSKQIGFYIDQPEMQLTHCYIKIAVRACSDFPCIIFDRPYVLMPVVPLNVQSRCTFEIFNDGYQNLNLKHIVVQELSSINIQLSYPGGCNLGITKKRIKVEAAFKHDKPLSFTLNVQFYDQNNRMYSLPISGTTDNCSYTIQEYLTSQTVSEEPLNSQQQLEAECGYLKRYLNSHVCFDRQIGRFPESMLEGELELLFEVLCFYSTSFDRLRTNRKCQTVQMTFTLLDDVIRVLKSEGALLNHIRPELLLGHGECMTYFRSIESAEKYYQIPWVDNEEDYQQLFKRSWVILIYQILRIYNSYRATAGRKTTLGGKTDQSVQKLSVEERVLVNWVDTTISNSETRFQPKPIQDFSTLADCEILSALLQKFTSVKVVEAYGKVGLTRKDIQKRCGKFVQALANIGVSTHIQADDLERSRQREMVLLVEQLNQILPNYLPKAPPIQFTCSLGQSVSKAIEISNPSKHTVSYWAKIEGSKDFQLQSEPAFVIEPKKSIEFKIKYLSHFSNTSQATVTFSGKKDNKSIPATMVFTLKGQTIGKVSEKCIQATCALYEQIEFNVSVTNNFTTEGEFRIQLQPERSNRPPSFFCLTDRIRVKKGCSAMLAVTFAPMVLEQQKCYLYFSDANVGEFQYEMTGIVEMPFVSNDIIRVTAPIYVDTPSAVEIALPAKNDLMGKARKQVQAVAENKNSRLQKGQQLYPKLLSEQYSLQLLPVTDMITCPKELNFNLGEEEETGIKREQPRKLQLNINMRMAVRDGVVMLVMKNASKTDIRRYKIVLNVINKPFRYVMEIRTHLFKQVTQPIPMVNPTQQPNTYSVMMLQDPKSNFSVDCDKEIVVEAGRTDHINLMFRPKTIGQFNSLLRMENLTISQIIEYELVGISEEPESIQLSYKQNAKESKGYEIKLQNQTNMPQRYAVKIELEYASGPPAIMVPPFSVVSYPLTIAPRYIGEYTGSIVFDDDGRYLSYKVSVDTRDTLPIKQFNLVCKQRQPTHLQVDVQQGNWAVTLSNPSMIGPKTFESGSGHQKYKLTYLSGKVSQSKVYAYFHSEQKGDFSYLINVNVVEAAEVKLNPFKAELGKAQSETIVLENTDDVKLKVEGRSSNPNTFSIEPASFTIPPKGSAEVRIIYTPSNLEVQTSEIILEADTGERWRYSASGTGVLPTYDEQKVIRGSVNSDTSTFISFRNPFKEKIQVIISLDKQPGEQIFHLILKNKRIEIEPLGLISIPVVFIPRLNERYESTLNVYMNERMSWKFVIVGLVTTVSDTLSKTFRFTCRQRKTEVVEFQLPQLSASVPPEFNEWTIRLKDVQPPCFTDLVEKVVNMEPRTVSLIPGTKTLRFQADLMAYRPFHASCTYELNQNNGCQWISKIDMLCHGPDPDDDIVIVSDTNTSTSVSFKLTNRFKSFAKFNAYFTAESDIQLSVSPKTGDLLPYGRQGTVFTLTFSPVEYRKQRSGRLVIETDQSYWSYNVKGVLPHYSPPKGVSQVISRLH